MALVDRVVEYPNRYILEDENGVQTGPYTLIRDPGTVTEAGTLLNAQNLTDEINALINAKLPVVVNNSAATGSVGSGSYKNAVVTITPPAGKSLAGITGIHVTGTNSSWCQFIGFYVDGNDVHVQFKNLYSGSINWTIEAFGICI